MKRTYMNVDKYIVYRVTRLLPPAASDILRRAAALLALPSGSLGDRKGDLHVSAAAIDSTGSRQPSTAPYTSILPTRAGQGSADK
jgi:hypothetical protein